MVISAGVVYLGSKGGNALLEKGFQMASLTTNILEQTPDRLRALGQGLLDLLVVIAEASPRYRLLQKYNALSDAQLAEMGMTRADVVTRVFGARIHF